MSKTAAFSLQNVENDALRQFALAETFFNHSVSCLVILDRDFNFLRVNDAYAKACCRDINTFVGHNHFELYPSDARTIFEQVVRTKQSFVTFTRAFEFVDQPERGVTYWDWTLVPVLDARGEVEYLVFSLIEVTERKRAEEALRIASLVYQHSAEAMMVTNSANQIIAVNDAFCKLTGYRPAEVLGSNPRMLKSGAQDPAFYQAMWQSLNECGHWRGELWDHDKHGRAIALRLSINTVSDDQGKALQRVALFSDITERKRAEELIWQQANIDPLTGVANRTLFKERLRLAVARARADGSAVRLMLIDLDQFKEVNDSLGHDQGDLLLIEVVHRISACLRDASMLARLGGDEFTVILAHPDDVAHSDAIAERIIASVAAPYQLGDARVFVSASVGLAHCPHDATDMADLLRHADQAMYASKNAGRNRHCHYTLAMQQSMLERMSISDDLRDALPHGQFELHYQPIVELASGRILKAEALLRWRHPVRGMVAPDQFIALTEASGLIIEIGAWVFRTAAEQLCALATLGEGQFQISVNVSPVQFHNDKRLLDMWLAHLARLKLPAHSIVIEITEGLLMNASAELMQTLRGFAAAGTQLSLDDFGTGYSSLAYLTRFDIDFLKIDKVFVREIENDANSRALCEAIIAMAHKLGLKVVAEGVETVGQRDLLAAAGCDFGQGYWFARPMPAVQFVALLAAQRT